MYIWSNTKTLDDYIDTIDIKENADIILMGSKPIYLDEFPNAKGIFRVGVGSNNIPFEEANKRNIQVRFPEEDTINNIYEETSNFTCHLIFDTLYSSVGCVEKWSKQNRKAFENNTLLIIGGGNIGNRVFDKMKRFMKVTKYDILESKEDDLQHLIANADCISLHIPLTTENINFIDKEKLSWMKDGSCIINTSRGGIVSEDALYDEIKTQRIKASFDVFWEEPYTGKLKKFLDDGFYMTPHIASTNEDFLQGSARDLMKFAEELRVK